MAKVVKSTVMRAEVAGSQIDCRADRNIDHKGETKLSVQLHLLKAGGAIEGGASGTINARSFDEMEETLKLFGEALRELRQADQA